MLKEVVSGADYSLNAIVGLLVFFVVFVGVCAWVLSRRKQTVDRWAALPLDPDEAAPRDPINVPHAAQRVDARRTSHE